MTEHSAWNDPARPTEERVSALLAELTLEEKVGQLGSYWLRPELGDAEGFAPMQSTFDEDRDTFEATVEHGLGHITRAFGSGPLDAAAGIEHLQGLQRGVIAASRLGIPAIAHEECLTGLMAHGATTYPAAIAWGASFDPELIDDMARRIGSDMRALGVHLGLSPVLDIVRDYRWGRIEETMGEDPYLTGVLATAYVQGLQSSGVVATLKHFAGHAASRAGRNHAPVSIGLRELHDIDLVPFEMAVRDGGAGAVMNSYADIDGVPPASDPWLLTELLRDTWGFDGTVVADYWAVNFLASMHGVAADDTEAAIRTLTAGLDVELPESNCYPLLVDAVRRGDLPEDVVDLAVSRVLRQKIDLGLLDADADPAADGSPIDLDAPENRAYARRMAEESIVLLRNEERTLPVAEPASIALLGPAATDGRTHLGCYSFTNHVLSRMGDQGTSVPVPTLADALADEFPAARLDVVPGVDVLDPDPTGIPAAVEAARAADLAVVAVGDRAGLFGTGTSGEGCDVVDLSLPGAQGELVEQILATGTPVVLVLITGRPYAIGAYAERCAAIVQAFMPGEEGGPAIAGVLSGRVNPSGHLPAGIPDHVGGQPGTYLAPRLAWESSGISNLDPRPLYPFGHGLSFTDFEVTEARVEAEEVPTDGTIVLRARVANSGDRAGRRAVQLYLSDPAASVVRPLKRLIGFTKLSLEAGESADVTFTVPTERTAFTGRDLRRVVEAGTLELRVGFSSEDPGRQVAVQLTGTDRTVPAGTGALTTAVQVSAVGGADAV
ncbi:MAG: glycoside hydrolase family 3 N-terminal domain-containing protein [Brachybacterium sp.]|nr:glycoside hydrolase family 3 N-terminal domain-containing protein [Brachybacterium sp.]